MFTYKGKVNPNEIGTSKPIDSCILFIHGFGGGMATWHTFSTLLANQWNLTDSFALEYDIHTVETRIPLLAFFKAGPSIDILAESLRTIVNELCKDYKNVIIVAHSMGGLIARQYLVNLVKDTKEVGKVKGLITYATPHLGSKVASLYKMFRISVFLPILYLTSRQVNQMCRYKSHFIDSLNEDWTNLRIEKKIDFRRIIGERDYIVDRQSAALEYTRHDSIANKGHFDIIKPKNSKDLAFLITFNYLKDFKRKMEEAIELEELNKLAEDDDVEFI